MDSDEDMLDASDSELMYDDDDLYSDDGCGSDEIDGDYESEDSQSLLTRRDQVGNLRILKIIWDEGYEIELFNIGF